MILKRLFSLMIFLFAVFLFSSKIVLAAPFSNAAIYSVDATSSGGGFLPATDIIPPGTVTNLFASSSERQIKLFWINPLDGDLAGVKIYRKVDSPPASQNDSLATVVYQGKAQSFIDVADFEKGKTYYYSIYAYDVKLNYSNARTTSVRFELNGIILETESTRSENNKVEISTPTSGMVTNLIGAGSAVVERVTAEEAKNLVEEEIVVELTEAEKKIYAKIVTLAATPLAQREKNDIARFVHSGTPTTKNIGAGERGGCIASFYSAFGLLPSGQFDWQEVIKIANGRWTTQRSSVAENAAKAQFKKVYGRDPNMSKQNDNAAVTVMAYGLRPALRSANSEKTAIKTFHYFYNVSPTSAWQWDIVRAIAYSGVKR